jgi:hypothetical protein
MEGCLVCPSSGSDEAVLSVCTYDDFCKLAGCDLMELGIDLPEGVEGVFSMYVQQDKQDPRHQHGLNVRATLMSRHSIYGDVLVTTRGPPMSLHDWWVFLGQKFPRQIALEEHQEAKRKKKDACSVQ